MGPLYYCYAPTREATHSLPRDGIDCDYPERPYTVRLHLGDTTVKTILFALLTILAVVLTASAQDDLSKVEIKATKISGNIYMLEGSGGNIGVSVGNDGILIVDDQFAPLADKIKAALKQLGQGKLKF